MPRLATPRTVVYVVLALMSPQGLAQAQTAAPGNAAPATSTSDPPEAVQAQYRDVVARAVVEFDAGRWAEARSLFLQAHALWPSARTYRTLGMTSFELRSYAHALQELEAALGDARRPLPDDQRTQVANLIEQTRAFVGRYRIRFAPESAELLVDGAPHPLDKDGVLLLEVGSHELLARASGHAELKRRLDVQGREDDRLAFELTPSAQQVSVAQLAAPAPVVAPPAAAEASAAPESSGSRLWTWVAGGTAIALGATSAGLWFASDNKYDSEFARCHPKGVKQSICAKPDVDTSWQDLETAHYVTLGFAIAAGVGAVTLFFLEGHKEESPRVAVGPGAVHVSGRF